MTDLFPYQQEGAKWLSTKRFALLADEMGLGKSAQAITAARIINATEVCIVCPASVRVNWSREWQKFWPTSRPPVPVMDKDSLPSQGSCVVSYDFLTRHGSRLRRLWDLVIADEIHLCKSVDSGRSHALLGAGGIVRCAPVTWTLSGTPAPNNYAEVWPLLRVANRYAGSRDQFISQFCTTRHTPYGTKIIGHKNIPEFRKLLDGFMLRRRKVEVMKDMPPINYSEVWVPPGPVDIELCFTNYWIANRMPEFHETLKEQRDKVEAALGLVRPQGASGLAVIEAIREHISVLRRYVGLQKVPAVIDLVKDELESGLQKIVIFAIHKDVIESLRVGLAKYGALTLYGGTAPLTRQANIDKFVNKPKHRVFIMNVQSVEGVDGLQRVCNQGLAVELDWVPGKNAQAYMRLHRIGQMLPVMIRTVMLEGDDLDVKIQRALARKTKDLIAAFD